MALTTNRIFACATSVLNGVNSFWSSFPLWFPIAASAIFLVMGYESRLKYDLFGPSVRFNAIMMKSGQFEPRYNLEEPYHFRTAGGQILGLYCKDKFYENTCLKGKTRFYAKYQIYYAPFENNIFGLKDGIIVGIHDGSKIILSSHDTISRILDPPKVPIERAIISGVFMVLSFIPLVIIILMLIAGNIRSIQILFKKGIDQC